MKKKITALLLTVIMATSFSSALASSCSHTYQVYCDYQSSWTTGHTVNGRYCSYTVIGSKLRLACSKCYHTTHTWTEEQEYGHTCSSAELG